MENMLFGTVGGTTLLRHRSPLRCLHHILELQEGIIRCGCLRRCGHGEHAVWNGGGYDLAESIEDIHDLAAWYGCNHLADTRIHGLIISRRGHKFAVHASQ